MGGWLQTKLSAHVGNLSSDNSIIDSCQLLRPGLSVPDAKVAAFILQNKTGTIVSTLQAAGVQISNDRKTEAALYRYRNVIKKKIESHCDGGVKLYEKRMNIAEAGKVYDNLVHGHEEPDDNSTFIHDDNKISPLVYIPALIGNNMYKEALEAMALAKHRLKSTSPEYIELNDKVANKKKLMTKNWEKKTDWWHSFQPRTSQISFPALLVPGVSDEESEAFLAWAKSFFFEEQMMKANLQVVYYKSDDIFPQSANLAEYERYPETEARLRFEARREESEGVTRNASLYQKQSSAAHRYIAERNKTLYLMAKAWLNPDHEASKIMLSQFKSELDADDEKRKKRNEKQRIRRKKKKSEIDDELEELVEEAFGLLKQQIVRFRT